MRLLDPLGGLRYVGRNVPIALGASYSIFYQDLSSGLWFHRIGGDLAMFYALPFDG